MRTPALLECNLDESVPRATQMKKLFTERYGLNEPRVLEEQDVDLTKGLLNVINAKIDENLFGEAFSDECPDGGISTDLSSAMA